MLIRSLLVSLVVTVLLAGVSGQANAQRGRSDDGAPKVGEVAPTFKLKMLFGEEEVNLQSYAGLRPVVLIFGSYT